MARKRAKGKPRRVHQDKYAGKAAAAQLGRDAVDKRAELAASKAPAPVPSSNNDDDTVTEG